MVREGIERGRNFKTEFKSCPKEGGKERRQESGSLNAFSVSPFVPTAIMNLAVTASLFLSVFMY